MRKPTVAALPGPAAGAGLAIALACDLRIASANAFVTTGYARVGLAGDYGIAALLTRLVGTAKARELMFTAARVDAETCARLGLVNKVVPADELRAAAWDLAKSLANGPAQALQLMKDNLDDALTMPFLAALDNEAARLIDSAADPDHREAVSAFVERRGQVFIRSARRGTVRTKPYILKNLSGRDPPASDQISGGLAHATEDRVTRGKPAKITF